MRRRWGFALAVLLGGCQCNREKNVDMATATPPPATAPASTNEPVLSALRSARQGTCDWVRIDPISKSETILASIAAPCDSMHVAWSHDRARGLLWIPVSYETDKPVPARAWEVTVGAAAKKLELPDGVEDLGFHANGDVVALVAEELTDTEMRTGKFTRGGKTYQLEEGDEGLPVLVHALRRESGAWKTIETKLSDTGWDLAMGVDALETAEKLGPRTQAILFQRGNADWVKEIPSGTPLLDKLKRDVPFELEDAMTWTRAETPHGDVYLLEECFEVSCAFRRIVFPQAGDTKLSSAWTFGEEDPAEAYVRGPWLLAVTSGEGSSPHLWDLRKKSLVWSEKEDGALFQVVFWP